MLKRIKQDSIASDKTKLGLFCENLGGLPQNMSLFSYENRLKALRPKAVQLEEHLMRAVCTRQDTLLSCEHH
jgi:hypothetical protein